MPARKSCFRASKVASSSAAISGRTICHVLGSDASMSLAAREARAKAATAAGFSFTVASWNR